MGQIPTQLTDYQSRKWTNDFKGIDLGDLHDKIQ